MPLFKYYRQFEALTEEEVNVGKREEADERRRKALARQEPLGLHRTTWPEYPPPTVVNAITYAARRGLHQYLDRRAVELRTELAHRHGLPVERLVIGDGSAQLLSQAAQALMEPGDELVTPWPSYGLYPELARRARGAAVPVPGFAVETVLSAVNPRTRLVVLCNPNDPTGELLGVEDLRSLLDALPERVVVLLDEALRDFVSSERVDAALELTAEHPRLLVFRTFSKAWGLAGLRVGYAIGGPGAEPLLERLEPELGLNELAQAGALEALRALPELPAQRGAAVAALRATFAADLRGQGFDVVPSQANLLWVARDGVDGGELAGLLERAGVLVVPGGRVGDAARVRVTVPHRPEHAERASRAFAIAARG